MKKFQILSILLLVTWTDNTLAMMNGKPVEAPATHNLKGEVTSHGRQQGFKNLSPDQMNGIRALNKFQSTKEYQKNPSKYNDVVNETHIANGTENVVFAKKSSDITFDVDAAPEKNVANNVDINNSNRPSDSPIQYTKTPSEGYSKKITIPDSEIQKIIDRNEGLLTEKDLQTINGKDFDINGSDLIICYDGVDKRLTLDTNGSVLYSKDPASFKNIIDKIEANNPHVLTELDVNVMREGQVEKQGDIISYNQGYRTGVQINARTGKIIYNGGKNSQSRLYNPKQEITFDVDAAPEKVEMNAKENLTAAKNQPNPSPIRKEPTLQDIEQITIIQNMLKPQNITSPVVLEIINKATTMDDIIQEFTQQIMTPNDPKSYSDISKIATRLYELSIKNENISGKEYQELLYLADKRSNIQFTMNSDARSSLSKKISNLTRDKQSAIEDKNAQNFSKNYKDNISKLYNDAIAKLQEQQNAAENQVPELPKVETQNQRVTDIIKSTTDKHDQAELLAKLIITSDSADLPTIQEAIKKSYSSPSGSNNKQILLAKIKIKQVIDADTSLSNLKKILESHKSINYSGYSDIKQYYTEKYIDALSSELIKPDNKLDIKKEMGSIIKSHKFTGEESEIISTNLTNLNALRTQITEKSAQQKNNINSARLLKEISSLEFAQLKAKSSAEYKVYNDNIGKNNTIAKTAYDKYLDTTFTILAKRGTLAKEMIKSTISSLFKSSGVKDPNGKVAERTTNNAMKNKPKNPNDPVATASWIQRWLVQPVSDFISYASGKNKTIKQADQASADASTAKEFKDLSLEDLHQAEINKVVSNRSLSRKQKIKQLTNDYNSQKIILEDLNPAELSNITRIYSDAIVNLERKPLVAPDAIRL